MPKLKITNIIISLLLLLPFAYCKSEQGKSDFVLTSTNRQAPILNTLFAGSKIYVQITCESKPVDDTKPADDSKLADAKVRIFWTLTELICWPEDGGNFEKPFSRNSTIQIRPVQDFEAKCSAGGHIILPELKFRNTDVLQTNSISSPVIPVAGNEDKTNNAEAAGAAAAADGTIKKPAQTKVGTKTENPVFIITKDGIYDFTLEIDPIKDTNFIANVHIEMKGPYGYLSASEWPLLPFYGIMCLVYVIYGVIWLIVSFLQWRDLLRIQFWIGGVILLGMLEKAVFYAEYQSVNSTGVSVQGAELAAEWVSCAKRTLARMLVIIMSLGFGIVKPRLGPMLHRVVGTGALYFILACVESYLRVMRRKNDQSNELLVASIPLAVLDSGICWWIFTSLVQTTRTLRLRRNMVKLSLYRHFTNTLIFSVIASVVFMLYSIRVRKTSRCSPGWREIWVDIAFWHVLFSVLLLVIMILWRPTNNNQRYAFTPLLDNPEDEDEEEEDQFVSDAYGVKMRGSHTNSQPKSSSTNKTTTTEEDDLRWVEENIPSAIADPALPVLDSDEEIINTKFEVSKMQ